ncbi:PaaX family transcriptional regulator C-terminal domain-containing protein [Actinomarinicola tropica]|uniref:PaaX family transcriptional regulator C-terminal domain-containing protein n=1 Tax=Actinomarinicola tropica TaxID=2789776 RepID=UPI001E63910A|nr:PaaX family transcriptional regulator C-terminal domain-containing protein [Actinomarinicola tropica]
MTRTDGADGARRALTARSVLLSVLLGTDPPRLPVSLLVGTTELFGISEGTTRTALSRMVAAGELRADDGRYEIAAPRLLQRQARQARSRRGATEPWEVGDAWLQAVVVVEGRRPADERAALRVALVDARLAELREGVWLRPANLGDVPPALAADPTLVWMRAHPDGPAALAARLWDLGSWSATADDLRSQLADVTPVLEAGDRTALAAGFVLSAAVLRHFQADPLLPRDLRPAGWPGDGLRGDYDRFDAAYRGVLRAWFDEHR